VAVSSRGKIFWGRSNKVRVVGCYGDRRVQRCQSSGMLRRIARYKLADVSKVPSASIIKAMAHPEHNYPENLCVIEVHSQCVNDMDVRYKRN
jgi:hypothetical protein